MRKILLFMTLSIGINFYAGAQRVRVRMDFPVNISVRPVGPPPFGAAVWVGPEWTWRSGRYMALPGYWSRPDRHRKVWVDGYWRQSRRNYVWIPGRWR